jgi:hypothetical protein
VHEGGGGGRGIETVEGDAGREGEKQGRRCSPGLARRLVGAALSHSQRGAPDGARRGRRSSARRRAGTEAASVEKKWERTERYLGS